jgi:proline dehydrogenase
MPAALVRTALSAALQKCHALKAYGIASTISLWNRVEHTSEQIAEEYVTSVHALGYANLDCYVSLKPLTLAFRRDLLMNVVDDAHAAGVRLHFDSPSAELADITFSAIRESRERHDQIGCTLPGRWPRSLRDAEWAVACGLTIRVVKGQWADPAHQSEDPREGFLAVIDQVAGKARHVSVATHDAPLAGEAVERLRAAGTPCEIELLVGQPVGHALEMAQGLGVPLRGYIPYGDAPTFYSVTPPAHAMRAFSPPPLLRSDARAHA